MYTKLLVPSRVWDFVSMDFVLGLPKNQMGNDSIFSFVERYFMMDNCAPCFKTSDATHISNLLFNEVVRLNGLPKSIILDKDNRFVGHFWRTL